MSGSIKIVPQNNGAEKSEGDAEGQETALADVLNGVLRVGCVAGNQSIGGLRGGGFFVRNDWCGRGGCRGGLLGDGDFLVEPVEVGLQQGALAVQFGKPVGHGVETKR